MTTRLQLGIARKDGRAISVAVLIHTDDGSLEMMMSPGDADETAHALLALASEVRRESGESAEVPS